MSDEWISAHLDGELSVEERDEFEARLAVDDQLAADYEALARVRSMLRGAVVEPPAGALDRVIATVEAADGAAGAGQLGDHAIPAPVVALAPRRRVPTLAAAAAAAVIIAGVVGGLGGPGSLPALGEFIERHEAAAAVVEGEPMPEEMHDLDLMPMDEASDVSPPMPKDYAMEHAFVDGPMVHLIYRTTAGDAVSVFRHEGDADVRDLGDGKVVTGDEADMWSAPMGGTHVAVVDGTGYVWVIVSEQPHDAMMDDMMHDLPSRSPSVMERVRDAAAALVEPFGF